MRIGILGTRGIPNNHGGFEQFAQHLAEFLVLQGHEVITYNSSSHPFKENSWKGVKLHHAFDPEAKIGTIGQFVYDFNCIINSRKQNFDIILQLGYTSSSIWGFLLPKKAMIVTNMDGLEWKRAKYNRLVQQFLKFAERLAIWSSDQIVADSIYIKEYLENKYNKSVKYIAYGSDDFNAANEKQLEKYALQKHQYYVLIARIEPENNIDTILDGYLMSETKYPFIVVGKCENSYSKFLKEKYKTQTSIKFIGGIYEDEVLNNLRYHAKYYFHGHSVGGTNPSLLEAMASNSSIVAHQNVFNQSILEDDALYFKTSSDVMKILNENSSPLNKQMKENNLAKVKKYYNWEIINKSYEDLFANLAH